MLAAAGVPPHAVVAFHGTLGAGKTTLIRGFARGLGIIEPVTSPTYTLVNEYRWTTSDGAEYPFFHVDLYRLHSSEEFELIGGDDILFGQCIAAIEWSEKVADILPPDHMTVSMEILSGGTRRIQFEGAAIEDSGN